MDRVFWSKSEDDPFIFSPLFNSHYRRSRVYGFRSSTVGGITPQEPLEKTVTFQDGTTLTGIWTDIDSQGFFTIRHDGGVRRANVNQVTEPMRTQFIEEANREKLIYLKDINGVSEAAPNGLVGLFGDLLITKPQLHFIWIACACIIISGLLMLIASFAESPVWGLCFLMFGISWIPFLFLHPRRAWKPTLLSFIGIGLFVVFAYSQGGEISIAEEAVLP